VVDGESVAAVLEVRLLDGMLAVDAAEAIGESG
jgi:hypothetical protein